MTQKESAEQLSGSLMEARLQAAERHFRQAIPASAVFEARPVFYDGETLRLWAPLEANRNHQGAFFGGSAAAIVTLAGWLLLFFKLQDLHENASVIIQKSTMHYLKPMCADVVAVAQLAPNESWPRAQKALRRHAKTKLRVRVGLWEGVEEKATFQGG
ncbi:MAG TPA: YiiD C-terminal domain-containing protein [Chthoniobacterales bacterium]